MIFQEEDSNATSMSSINRNKTEKDSMSCHIILFEASCPGLSMDLITLLNKYLFKLYMSWLNSLLWEDKTYQIDTFTW